MEPFALLKMMGTFVANGMTGRIVCSMDARRNQVYNAVFAAEGGQLTRLTPDRAIALSQLAEKCDPPVTKSCMNHRMRKLLEEAKKL